MIRKERLPELLAPAGDMESLIAAVRGGANAVYVGGKAFSARAYAKNFDIEEISYGVRYCHLHGVKLYVTVNTLLSDKEIPEAVTFASKLYNIGVDAIIIADVGLIRAIKNSGNPIELHASTQLSAHNIFGADQTAKMGCTRVVLARELSGENIKKVTEGCIPEVEVFVHGALCVCHSGQCLFSSMVGGRSGNRGECAQPCRLPFNGGYPLSLRDLSLAKHIPELIESGVASLKIEGRMKSPGYVYTVTSIYRRLLDECRPSNKREDEILTRAFSRSGFTDGYFTENLNKMTGIRSEEDKDTTSYICDGEFKFDKVEVKAQVAMKLGSPATMSLQTKDGRMGHLSRVVVTGDVCQGAISRPLDEDGVKQRLAKMGQTLLTLSTSDIECDIEEGVNLSPASINALRRSAAEAFECQNTRHGCGVYEYKPEKANNSCQKSRRLRTAMLYDPHKLSALGDFFDIVFLPLWKIDQWEDLPSGVAIPPIVMENEVEEVEELLRRAAERGVRYALVSNIGGIDLATGAGLVPVADHRMNITNREAKDYWSSIFCAGLILSCELCLPAVRDVGGGIVVWGRLPLMITERCFMKDTFGCQSCSDCSLTDRRGMTFPMMREFRHRTLIFNSTPTYVGDMKDEISRFVSGLEHFIFSIESEEEIRSVISDYKQGRARAGIRRVGIR